MPGGLSGSVVKSRRKTSPVYVHFDAIPGTTLLQKCRYCRGVYYSCFFCLIVFFLYLLNTFCCQIKYREPSRVRRIYLLTCVFVIQRYFTKRPQHRFGSIPNLFSINIQDEINVKVTELIVKNSLPFRIASSAEMNDLIKVSIVCKVC